MTIFPYARAAFTSTFLVASFASDPALTQELAEEVGLEYFQEIEQAGMLVSFDEQITSGQVVEWKNIVFRERGTDNSYTLKFLRAEEIGGGKVSMQYPPKVHFQIPSIGDQPAIDVIVSGEMEHIVSGTKVARDHLFTSDELTMSMNDVTGVLNLEAVLSNMGGQFQNTGDPLRNGKGTFGIGAINMTYEIIDGSTNMNMKAVYNDLAASYDMDSISKTNISELFDGNRNMSVTYSMASSQTKMDAQAHNGSAIMETSTGSGSGKLKIQNGTLNVSGLSEDTNFTIQMKELPLPPFSASIKRSSAKVAMPLKKTNSPRDARLQFGFEGLKASDTVWGMFDPTGSLPRDEATLNIDVSAQLKWLTELLKVGAADDMPVEVSSVTINDLLLDVAGVIFTGNGSTTLDNSSFPPVPAGEVSLDLKGGITLLDKLVSLRLIPEQQGQMMKMMSGVFSVPGGEGTDHLVTKIEMKEDGAILANGQPLQ